MTTGTEPSLPPLMTPLAAPSGGAVLDRAARMAAAGEAGAGDLVWRAGTDTLGLALVMEPEVSRRASLVMLPLAQVAAGEALAAIAPPETDTAHRWSGDLIVNGAAAGVVEGRLAPCARSDVPDWLVVGIRLRLAPGRGEPGDDLERTSLEEELGPIEPVAILEAVARHWMVWLHRWESEGFAAVARAWDTRADRTRPIDVPWDGTRLSGPLMGLDEEGGALLRTDDGVRTVPLEAIWAGPA